MSHQHLEVPRFPRGFVLSERPVDPPPTFVPGPILPNFYVHPWANVETAGDPDLFVIILGHVVSTRSEQAQPAAEHLLACLRAGEGTFLKALDDYGGRHALIFGSAGDIRVVNDATGMRSVFYAVKGGVVASHALLVEQALGGVVVRGRLPFRYGYPGNLTPYARTKILTPNTYYWLTANVVRRFWPIVEPAPRPVEDAAVELLEASTNTFRAMTEGRTVRLTLTAGLDSRTILAIALHSGIPFEAYTYGNQPSSKVDRLLAADLAAEFGFEHTVLSEKVVEPVVAERLTESHYSLHHSSWVASLQEYFSRRDDAAVLGNALEIGRSNYAPQRDKGVAAPVTAETMASSHHMKLGSGLRQRVEKYGPERFWSETVKAFQSFIDDTGWDVVAGMLDPFDQFYWEHRMAAWQGVAMGERDFYGEPFIPYNSRRVFNALLGAPFESRREDAAVLRMIEMVDSRLLGLPVNPTSWPTRVKAKV